MNTSAAKRVPVVRLRLGGAAPHLSQITTGFTLLQARGVLQLVYEGFRGNLRGRYCHGIMAEAALEDGRLLAYDMADGYEEILRPAVFDAQLDGVFLYFKRAYDRGFLNGARNRAKVRALGLNYFVSCPGNPLPASGAQAQYTAEFFMSHNSYAAYKGLFLTRLWDPGGIRADALQRKHTFLTMAEAETLAARRVDETECVNRLRTGCIRACREAFGPRFLGGLEDSFYTRGTAPDLIGLPTHTRKDAFLRLLQKNYVCLANDGLHRSTGWKMAEYTAAGRAVLTQPLAFGLPGGFRRGQNYATYKTPEECVRALESLLENPARVHRMEAANFAYYCNYVRPDAMVLRTLRDAAPEMFLFEENDGGGL
ncbi:MAG: glycosyltransferase [Oscillospiraceae bacterium]|nr:glycosyltransferase [Oscillospiraceae bacterium]